jgi:thioredoxin-like negative regulator of GroEL
MIERLLIVLLLAAVGVLVYRWQTRRQLQQISSGSKRDPLLADVRPGVPVIVYFTTPGCLPCRTRQQPALKTLQASTGASVQILTVDATEQPEAADRWGVMSAPTTFVLDENGHALAVNHGVADADTLRQQLGLDAAAKVA